MEDFLFEERRKDQSNSIWLLLWRNKPCVVLGRNQNPWKECNFSYLQENQIALTRRLSGGGAVYHDLNNTCITIFSQKHQPDKNLKFSVDVLKKKLGLHANIGPRKDIWIDDMKVSGSAFRITSKAAYHHFTLLINTDLDILTQVLQPTQKNVQSTATDSVRSKVANINQIIRTLNSDEGKNEMIERQLKRLESIRIKIIEVKSNHELHLKEIQSLKSSSPSAETQVKLKMLQDTAIEMQASLDDLEFEEMNELLVLESIKNKEQVFPPTSHEYIVKAFSDHLDGYFSDTSSLQPAINIHWTESDVKSHPTIIDTYKRLASWEHIIGRTPDFSNTLETTFSWGKVDAKFQVNEGIISSLEITGDIDLIVKETFINACIGQRYQREVLEQLFKGYINLFDDDSLKQNFSDLSSWFCSHTLN